MDVDRLIAEFADGPRQVREALGSVAPERLDVRPRPQKWSAREIALHLCDTEISVAFRMKRAIAEPGGAVLAFDQDCWANALGPYQDLNLALSAFAAVRTEMAAILGRLPAESWAHVSVHPEAGAVRLDEWLARFVEHTRRHIGQILALAEDGLAAGGAPSPSAG